MNIQDLKELMQKMADTGINELKLEQDDGKVTLKRTFCQPADPEQISLSGPGQTMNVVNNRRTGSETSSEAAVKEELPEQPAGELIKSPVVGIFYSSPSPDSDPFVQTGSRIEVGTTVCIIEAMKLMNEVTSSIEGEIVEIFVENGQRVEFGQPLFCVAGQN